MALLKKEFWKSWNFPFEQSKEMNKNSNKDAKAEKTRDA